MKSIVTLASAALLAISLGACTIGGTTVTINPTDVLNATKSACAFEPTAATIAAEMNANPTITQAVGIAALICQAVETAQVTNPPASSHRGTAPGVDVTVTTVVVNGKTIPIIGRFDN